MALNYYIDESGNSGDVLSSGENYNFNGQPVFSLACIGVDNVDNLKQFISNLKIKYRIQGSELKSTKIYKNKPSFIVDIVEYLGKEKIPIFIEVVDKKYYISANLVNCHVMPAYSSPPETQESRIARNHCADFIYENAPRPVFDNFIFACKEPSNESLSASFDELYSFIRDFSPANALSDFLKRNIEESINDYEEHKVTTHEAAHRKFIPVPDDSKRNKSIWMLPNLSSFTNIYARINLHLNGKISDANIFHDEQVHFDEIISHNKELMEGLDMKNAISIPTANYNFSETSSLEFAKSHEHCPIQVADILAGTAMRYVKEKIQGYETSPEIVKAYDAILRCSDPNRGVGINLVTTSKLHYELHF